MRRLPESGGLAFGNAGFVIQCLALMFAAVQAGIAFLSHNSIAFA